MIKKMPIASINGIKLYYEASGEGKPVVMLHGYVGDIEDWRNQIDLFSSSYRVYALDQRGRGKSDAPKDEELYSFELFVEDVYRWLKLMKVEKCCLIGHSMGGMVAMRFTLAHPEMVEALVLADTTSDIRPTTPDGVKYQQKLYDIAVSQGTVAAFDYDLETNLATKKRYQLHPETLTRMREKTRTTPVWGYVNARKSSGKRTSITDQLGKIKVPTLIIYAEHDLPYMIAAAPEMHQEISDSDLIMIENSGHGPMYERPDEFNEALLGFFKRINW